MNEIYNHASVETFVEINGQAVRLAAGGCLSGLDATARKELLAAAKAQKVDWRTEPVTTVRVAGVEQVAREAATRELAKLGPLVPLTVFREEDLTALSRETLQKIGAAVGVASLPDATKKEIITNILAVSSTGRTPGLSPGESGSIPDAASNPPTEKVPTPSAGGNQAVNETGTAVADEAKE